MRFLSSAGALIAIPLFLLDRAHLLVLAVVWAAIWGATWLWLRPFRRHLYILTVLLPLTGFAGEMVFRFRYFGWDGFSFDHYRPASYGHPWSGFEFSRNTYTGLKGRQTVVFKGSPFRVNDRGFRGADYSLEKPENVYRIIVTGASVPLGSGVADDETMFAVLERALNEALPGHRVEVLNLSRGGSSLGAMVHTIRHAGLAYQPDLIFVFMDEFVLQSRPFDEQAPRVRNLHVSTIRKIIEPRYSFFSSRFFFFRAVRVHTNAVGRRVLEFFFPPDRNKLAVRELALAQHAYLVEGVERLKDVVGDRKVALYVLRQQDTAWRDEIGKSFRDVVDELAEQHGMYTLIAPSGLLGGYQESELVLYPGDRHPNALAHRLYGEGLFPQVLDIVRNDLGLPHEND